MREGETGTAGLVCPEHNIVEAQPMDHPSPINRRPIIHSVQFRWHTGLVLLLGLLSFQAPGTGAAEPLPPQAGTVRLADLIDEAYANNPSILQAREMWRATVENHRVTTAYPNPQLMVTWFPEPIETRLGPQDWNVQLSQTIPFPGKLSKAGEMVAADARVTRLKLDKTVKETMLNVRESFYELWYIRQARRVTRHNADLLDHLVTVGEAAHADDRATYTDVVKAQSQKGQLQYDALLLEELEATETTRLNGLLNRPVDAVIGDLQSPMFAPLSVALETIYQLAEANQEDIQMAQANIDKREAGVSLARYQNLPEFKVGLFYAGIGQPDVTMVPEDAGRDAFGVQAGISIPLWFGRNTSRVEKALAERSAARAEKVARTNTIRTTVRTLYFKARNAQRIVMLYETDLVPQAARAMETAETWYREGESAFTDFIETQSVWYNFQLALTRARADYGINLARLERMAGAPLSGTSPERLQPTAPKVAP